MRLEIGLSLSVLVTTGSFGCASTDSHPQPTPVDAAASGALPTSSVEASASASPSASATVGASATAPTASATASANPPKTPAPLPKGMKVLIIGDSFAEALGAGLKYMEKDTGIKAVLRGQKATFIPEWAGPNKGVAGMLIQEKPDLVLIALGGNELAMTTPDIRAPKVKELVGLLGTTPCVWVSPPLWGNKDNGLLEIIRKNSGPCRYFDSNTLVPNLPRGSDKIHPTVEGQRVWAKSFLEWVQRERDEKSEKLVLFGRPASE